MLTLKMRNRNTERRKREKLPGGESLGGVGGRLERGVKEIRENTEREEECTEEETQPKRA